MEETGALQPVTPFWDIVLRHKRHLRLELFKRLIQTGLVGLRLRIRSRAALFFVAKKDGTLRLIVDGREASMLHRRPPSVGLGSAAAMSSIDLSDAALNQCTASGRVVHGASLDLQQAFYQVTWPEVVSFFGFDYPEPISEFGQTHVYDEVLRCHVEVPSDTVGFPVYQGLPLAGHGASSCAT